LNVQLYEFLYNHYYLRLFYNRITHKTIPPHFLIKTLYHYMFIYILWYS